MFRNCLVSREGREGQGLRTGLASVDNRHSQGLILLAEKACGREGVEGIDIDAEVISVSLLGVGSEGAGAIGQRA